MSLLCIVPVSPSDEHTLPDFTNVLEHFCPNGGYLHNLLIAATPEAQQYDDIRDCIKRLMELFKEKTLIETPAIPEGEWPKPQNHHFTHAIDAYGQMCHSDGRRKRQHFLWLEPDCTPLCVDWSGRLYNDYIYRSLPYYGVKTPTYHAWEDTKAKRGTPAQFVEQDGFHMSGVAIYPGDYLRRLRPMKLIPGEEPRVDMNTLWKSPNDKIPFDVFCRSYHQPFWNSDMILHKWRTSNFRIEEGQLICDDQDEPDQWQLKEPSGRFRPFTLSNAGPVNITTGALLHGCKDGSLAKLVISGALEPFQSVQPNQTAGPAIDYEKEELRRKVEEYESRESRPRRGGGLMTARRRGRAMPEPVKP